MSHILPCSQKNQFMLTLQLLTTPVKSPVYRMDFSMLIIISSGSVNDLGLKMFYELKKFLYVKS